MGTTGTETVQVWLYLVELDEPLGDTSRPGAFARYYLGIAHGARPTAVARRLATHRSGTGSAMLRAANERGIPYRVIATWRAPRSEERRLKTRGHFRDLARRMRGTGIDQFPAACR